VDASQTQITSVGALGAGSITSGFGAIDVGSSSIDGGTITGTFSGNITGNVTGNASGTAATVTGAAQTAITSVGTLTSLGVGAITSTGDLTATQSDAGTATNTFANSNNSNAAAHLRLATSTGGASGGDPYIYWIVTGQTDYYMGIDNSDSDKLKIGDGSAVGTNTAIEIDTSQGVALLGALSVSSTSTLTGNVGIGQSAGSAALEVTGTTTLSSTLSCAGTATFTGQEVSLAKASTGAAVIMQVQNSGDEGNYAAEMRVTNGSGGVNTGGDAFLGLRISGGASWSVGIDNNQDDEFVISNSTDIGTNNAIEISTSQNVHIVNVLTAGTKTFKIDHPLPDKTDSHHLIHSCIEGPRADLIYRGTVDLSGGSAQVDLDEAAGMTEGTFEVLCRDSQCFVQNDSGWDAVRGGVEGNTLTIECEGTSSSDTVSWMVVAERCDPHIMAAELTDDDGHVIVEPEKEEKG
jgi:hypothetical protein